MANSYRLFANGRTLSFWADKTSPDVEGNIITSYQYLNNSTTPVAYNTLKFTLGNGIQWNGYYEGTGSGNMTWGSTWLGVTPDDTQFHHYMIYISRTGSGFGDTIAMALYIDGIYKGSQITDQHHPTDDAWLFSPFGIGSRLTAKGTPDANGYQYGQYRQSDGALGGFGQLWLGTFANPEEAIANLYRDGYVYLGDTGTHGAQGTISPILYNSFDYPYSQTYGYSNGFQVPLTSDYTAYEHPPGLFGFSTETASGGTIKQFQSREPLGLKTYSSAFTGTSAQYAITTEIHGRVAGNTTIEFTARKDPILSATGTFFRNYSTDIPQNDFSLGYTNNTTFKLSTFISYSGGNLTWTNSVPNDIQWHTYKITLTSVLNSQSRFELFVDGISKGTRTAPSTPYDYYAFFDSQTYQQLLGPDFNGELAQISVSNTSDYGNYSYSTTLDRPFGSEITTYDHAGSYTGTAIPYYFYGSGVNNKPWSAKFSLKTYNFKNVTADLRATATLYAQESSKVVDQAHITARFETATTGLRIHSDRASLSSKFSLSAKPYFLANLQATSTLRTNATKVTQSRVDLTTSAAQTAFLDRFRSTQAQMVLTATMLAANNRFRSTISRPKVTASQRADLGRIRNVTTTLASTFGTQANAIQTHNPKIGLQAQANVFVKPRHDYTGIANISVQATIRPEPYNFKQFRSDLTVTTSQWANFGRLKYYQADLHVQVFELSVGTIRKLDPYYQYRITPESRHLVISAESRMITIRPEQRTYRLDPENRLLGIIPEDRVNIIEGQQ